MKQQRILFELNKELSKKAVGDIIDILTNEKAQNIDINYLKGNAIDKLVVAYNKRLSP